MKKLLVTLGLAFAMSSVGSAATLCSTLIGSDVTTIGSCSIGHLTFSNFQILQPVNIVPTVSLSGAIQSGYNFGLSFALSHTPGQTQAGADFILAYDVTGNNQTGIGIELGNASNMAITEVACTQQFGGFFGTTCIVPPAASYSINVSRPAPPGTTVASATFATPLNTVYIQKDLSFGANGSISDFVNTHTAVPEPTTSLLMGTALLGLALLRKRFVK